MLVLINLRRRCSIYPVTGGQWPLSSVGSDALFADRPVIKHRLKAAAARLSSDFITMRQLLQPSLGPSSSFFFFSPSKYFLFHLFSFFINLSTSYLSVTHYLAYTALFTFFSLFSRIYSF